MKTTTRNIFRTIIIIAIVLSIWRTAITAQTNNSLKAQLAKALELAYKNEKQRDTAKQRLNLYKRHLATAHKDCCCHLVVWQEEQIQRLTPPE